MNKTPLYDLHLELGAKMVPFAGYAMPVQYKEGILREHLHTRQHAGLFDVSHMGQIEISGPQAQQELEKLLPLDLDAIVIGAMAYSFLPNLQGGVIDDLIVTRRNRDHFVLVVNAGCKDKVIAYLSHRLPDASPRVLAEHALLALQGPKALEVLRKIFPVNIARLDFMQSISASFNQVACVVSRCGYTGEDGFEISIASGHAETLARQLLSMSEVKPIGLGARDSLRLEAGLCLYGHELDETISPITAGLGWTIPKSRRSGGKKSGGFVNSDVILAELVNGTKQKRVGLKVQSKVPVREGAVLFGHDNQVIGKVSSGTFSPTLNAPVAMGFVDVPMSKIGSSLKTLVRDKEVMLEVCPLPFVSHQYVRK